MGLFPGSEDAVGTTGRLELSPNAVNSVPRGALLEIDVRDIDGARRDATVAAIVKEAAAIAKRRKVRHTVSVINQDPPATCSDEVRSRGLQGSRECKHACHGSGASWCCVDGEL